MDDLELLKRILTAGPIGRQELALAFARTYGCDLEPADRLARRAIERARSTTDWGALILPEPYRLAKTPEELAGFLASERHRGLTILARVREQRRRGLDALKALPLQQGRFSL